MNAGPIKISDIAKLLNLSKSTISRALKNHPDISQETKDAVMLLAQTLHYRPNSVAVSLRHRESKIIGLVIPQISYFFFPSVVKGIEDVINQYGYKLMIFQSNEEYEREINAIEILMSGNVEGILLSVSKQTEATDYFSEIMNTGMPVVFFDRVPENFIADMVLVDDTDGAFQATKHLINTGKTKIAICSGHPSLLISKNRQNGYEMALKDAGFDINQEYIIRGETPEEVQYAMSRLLDLPAPPNGIFAISDLVMLGIMQAIYAKKLRIPEDIGVIGFCEEPLSLMYNPQLSTIKPKGYEIGMRAAQMLFHRIQNPKSVIPPERVHLSADLVIKGSTVSNE